MKECTKAYQELKDLLLKEPVVAYPDFSVPFRLYTDASNIGLGVILTQKQEGRERIICCASRTLKGVDREKSAVFKELTQSFRTYELRGQAKKKKKKALTESKTNKYLTLSYKNYLQKA